MFLCFVCVCRMLICCQCQLYPYRIIYMCYLMRTKWGRSVISCRVSVVSLWVYWYLYWLKVYRIQLLFTILLYFYITGYDITDVIIPLFEGQTESKSCYCVHRREARGWTKLSTFTPALLSTNLELLLFYLTLYFSFLLLPIIITIKFNLYYIIYIVSITCYY